MERVKIPGLDFYDSDEESSSQRLPEPPAEKHFIAIDVDELAVKLISMPYSTPDKNLAWKDQSPLVILTDEQWKMFGRKLDDDDIDYEKDDYLHCDGCDTFYEGMCKEHPMYWVTDRTNVNNDRNKTRAEATAPLFIKIKPSSIPGAGKGCFADMVIPRGFVFGPYQGVMRSKADEAEKDGYCWEIKNKENHGFIDASYETHSNWMRFINHSHTEEEQNVLAFQYLGSIYYRVVKKIEKNEEILVYYGEAFAQDLLNAADRDDRRHVVNTIRRPSARKRRSMSRNPFIL